MSFAHLKMTLSVKQAHEEYAPRLRWTAIERAVEEFEAICEAACNCEAKDKSFRIPVERDTPSYLSMEQARVDRIIEADEEVKGRISL